MTFEPGNGRSVFSEHLGRGTGAIRGDFGRHPREFDEARFSAAADLLRRKQVTDGGVYCPVLFSRAAAIKVGGYPPGNLAGKDFETVAAYGDRLFHHRLAAAGVKHITSHESIVYHFGEGERNE
jgi:hypothetical protein